MNKYLIGLSCLLGITACTGQRSSEMTVAEEVTTDFARAYFNYENTIGGYVEWTVEVAEAGNYDVAVIGAGPSGLFRRRASGTRQDPAVPQNGIRRASAHARSRERKSGWY